MPISVLDLFKIGVGPSSSHTIGPMQAAHDFVRQLEGRKLLAAVDRIEVRLYGSLRHWHRARHRSCGDRRPDGPARQQHRSRLHRSRGRRRPAQRLPAARRQGRRAVRLGPRHAPVAGEPALTTPTPCDSAHMARPAPSSRIPSTGSAAAS